MVQILFQNFTINYWINKGAQRKKLVMGVPLYGQSFALNSESNNGLGAGAYAGGEPGDETRSRGFLALYEVVTVLNLLLPSHKQITSVF